MKSRKRERQDRRIDGKQDRRKYWKEDCNKGRQRRKAGKMKERTT